jgi:hypothetical protein
MEVVERSSIDIWEACRKRAHSGKCMVLILHPEKLGGAKVRPHGLHYIGLGTKQIKPPRARGK